MKLLGALCVFACASKTEVPKVGSAEPTMGSAATPTTDTVVPADPCSAAALSLQNVTALPGWTPPAGCTAKPGPHTTRIHVTDNELAARVECTGAAIGIDVTKHALLEVTSSMSPATVGQLAYDDGKVVTIVSKFRSNCPNDPRPMPMNWTRWYLVPAGAARTFAQATCTIPSKC